MSQNHFGRMFHFGTSNHRKSLTIDPPKIISQGEVQSFQNHYVCRLPTPQNHFKLIKSKYDFEGLALVQSHRQNFLGWFGWIWTILIL